MQPLNEAVCVFAIEVPERRAEIFCECCKSLETQNETEFCIDLFRNQQWARVMASWSVANIAMLLLA